MSALDKSPIYRPPQPEPYYAPDTRGLVKTFAALTVLSVAASFALIKSGVPGYLHDVLNYTPGKPVATAKPCKCQ